MSQSTAEPAPRSAAAERVLLDLVSQALPELRENAPVGLRVALESSLDRDLGLDSLARVELLLRIERAFGIDLPQDALSRAESVRDLLDAIAHAPSPGSVPWAPQMAAATQMGGAQDVAVPQDAGTLLQVLDWHVARHPEKVQIIYLADDAQHNISFQELARGADTIAAGLAAAGLRVGQCVAIMLPTSAEYFQTYFGILRAGGIPVPIYPPARVSQLRDHVLRHTGILTNAQTALMVTDAEAIAVAHLLQARVPGLRRVLTPQQLAAEHETATQVAVHSDDIAFIQYTSGSTGNPKGVILTHANLLANIRAIVQAIQATPRDVFVSWLPLYHDMGLIGAFLGTLYVGCPLVVMSPLAFLAKPERWLWAIHRFRGTLSAGPNFAYELCLRRIEDAALEGLDLSSLRLAMNGAEAVSASTVLRFAQRFAKYGFKPEALAPVYGLAEASVGLLFPPLGRAPRIDRIQREALSREGGAVPAAADDANALAFVACGRPLAGHAIRIVDASGIEVAERIEGRLEFTGPSATQGYFGNAAATAQLFHGKWLDTGDRAYVADGDVYLTGRVKDIIIRGGRNLYPESIEEAVGAVHGVRKGAVAAFGSPDPRAGTERLIVLAEARSSEATRRAQVRDAISRAIFDAIGEPADEIVLAPPHTVLKTSSGKVRRSACRTLYEQGRIGTAPPSARWQMLRLAAGAIAPQMRNVLATAGHALYGLYAALVFLLLALGTWLLTQFTRSQAAAWAIGRSAARLFLRLVAISVSVRGLEHLAPNELCILVCNHSSYLDGVLLISALPRPFAFVAKRELRTQFFAGRYLTRL
ncbi:MAG TPA: AMP-binding protein, partial [Burkholderiaceae bacterium]|nr:AMP-binding protein [Burkholderiaceae bacterium]